jgi:polyhydroxyalkanoate synthesis regulator phasin
VRRKWLIAVAAAVFALAVAGGAVFAAARRGDSGPAAAQADRRSEEQDKLLANVAAKLGLDVAKVKDAHQQAVRAVETEQRTRLLNDLVAKGRLTREQADALNSWLGSRPELAGKLPGVPGLPGIPGAGPGVMPMPGGHAAGPGMMPMPGGHGPSDVKPAPAPNDVFVKMAALLGKDVAAVEKAFKEANGELANERRKNAVTDQLDRLVKDGVITEQEAAEIKAWVEKAPAFLSDGTAVPFMTPRGPMRPDGHGGGRFAPGREPRGKDGFRFRQFGIPWHGLPGAAPGTPAPSQPVAPPDAKGA